MGARVQRLGFAILIALLALSGTAAPTLAQQQQQSGLVNVAVGNIKTGDIASNNTVTVDVAANTAATVCNVAVTAAVISDQIAKSGSYTCNGATQFVRITQASK